MSDVPSEVGSGERGSEVMVQPRRPRCWGCLGLYTRVCRVGTPRRIMRDTVAPTS